MKKLIENAGQWVKAEHSNSVHTSGGNNCPEVMLADNGIVGIRNSTHKISEVWFTPGEWRALVQSVKDGQYDL